MELVRKFRKLEPLKESRAQTEHSILEHCDGFSDKDDVRIQECLTAAETAESMRECLRSVGS